MGIRAAADSVTSARREWPWQYGHPEELLDCESPDDHHRVDSDDQAVVATSVVPFTLAATELKVQKKLAPAIAQDRGAYISHVDY